jgi:Fe-S-cluster containining protein
LRGATGAFVSADLEREGSLLCAACGACCDGTMFSTVELDPATPAVVRRRLGLLDEGTRMLQPCPHRSSEGCAVYEVRPTPCRGFRCKQLREHLDGGGELEARLAKVRAVRALSERLRAFAGRRGEGPADRTTHWGLYAAVHERADVPAAVALDLVELTVRRQRDLGWSPPSSSTEREEPQE